METSPFADTRDVASPLDPLDPRIPARRSAFGGLQAVARSPRRWALAAILSLAACLNFYSLQTIGYANLYYAATVRSMLESWHNFFFVSFDPGGFVSVDKPPLGFWIQAASARLLGFSGFSILLPEALAGVASVGVLYLLLRRVFGTVAGLLAALFLALTPISVVTNRNNTIDSLLVLTVLLGAYAVSRAVERESLRWLLLCALLMGLGFNIKMLEAFLVVPAFAMVYLLGAPLGWWRRLRHLALAGAALLAVSLSWVLAVDLTPASARPYVGSSGSNSELALALGYNGLQRLLGTVFRIPSNVAAGAGAPSASAPGGPGGAIENGAQGLFRLLNAQLGGQASWLLALGLLGLLASGWGLRPRALLAALMRRLRSRPNAPDALGAAHLTREQSALVLWASWTLTQIVFFSVAGFFHRYYLVMLAPGVAALAGVGVVLLWRDYRDQPVTSFRGWLLPLTLVVTAITQGIILADYTGWNAWMTPLVVGGALVVAVALVWYRLTALRSVGALSAAREEDSAGWVEGAQHAAPARVPGTPPHRAYGPLLAVALGVAVLLVGPVTWTTVALANSTSGVLPSAGPTTAAAQVGASQGSFQGGFQPPAIGAFGPPPGRPALGRPAGAPAFTQGAAGLQDQADSQLVAYLEAHQGSATFLFATLSSQTAAPYIIATGKPIMTLGGFSGSDQILTLSQLETLVHEGQVRYFLLPGRGGFGGAGPGSGNDQLVQWIESHATAVPTSAYGGSPAGGLQLYVVANPAGS
jgi:4-amino-4-deoxy-L-arabinose transferase-like glycosyltransferase